MINKRISINYVIEKIYRDLGTNKELPYDDMVEFIGEALLKIGAYSQFIEKTCELEISNSRAKVPCDLYKLKLVMYNNEIIPYVGNGLLGAYFCDDCKVPTCIDCTGAHFYINDSYIFLNLGDETTTSGDLCIEYIGIDTDDKGYPTIPDDPMYMEACKAYVTMKLDYIDWRNSRIPDKVFQHSEREWYWYVGAAKGAANLPDLNSLERLKNVMVRLLPLQNEFKNAFSNTGIQERKYLK